MRILLLVVLLMLLNAGYSQRILLQGKVVDNTETALPGTHIRNITTDKITVSTIEGSFTIPCQPTDTLLLTNVGYDTLVHILSLRDFEESLILNMKEGTISLNEVTVLSLPTLQRFKEMVMETKVEDSATFWYYGVPKPVVSENKMLAGKKHKKLLYAVIQPTNFLYYNLSKAEKEKRKFYELNQQQQTRENADQKFTHEWVSEQTGLVDDELTDFIAFCNFSYDYLDRFPLYVIREDMLVKLKEFKK